MEEEPWVSMRTIAKFTSLSYQHVRKLADEGVIPCKDVGLGDKNKKRIFKKSLVDAALEALEKTA